MNYLLEDCDCYGKVVTPTLTRVPHQRLRFGVATMWEDPHTDPTTTDNLSNIASGLSISSTALMCGTWDIVSEILVLVKRPVCVDGLRHRHSRYILMRDTLPLSSPSWSMELPPLTLTPGGLRLTPRRPPPAELDY